MTKGKQAARIHPVHHKDFERHVEALNLLLYCIQMYEPTANYYVDATGICLMLGQSHTDTGKPLQSNIALQKSMPNTGGGDW